MSLKRTHKIKKYFLKWKTDNIALLKGIEIGAKPKEIILVISESILEQFSELNLIDKYDTYQHLMTYWSDVMQDDIHIIAQSGWNIGLRYKQFLFCISSFKHIWNSNSSSASMLIVLIIVW